MFRHEQHPGYRLPFQQRKQLLHVAGRQIKPLHNVPIHRDFRIQLPEQFLDLPARTGDDHPLSGRFVDPAFSQPNRRCPVAGKQKQEHENQPDAQQQPPRVRPPREHRHHAHQQHDERQRPQQLPHRLAGRFLAHPLVEPQPLQQQGQEWHADVEQPVHRLQQPFIDRLHPQPFTDQHPQPGTDPKRQIHQQRVQNQERLRDERLAAA